MKDRTANLDEVFDNQSSILSHILHLVLLNGEDFFYVMTMETVELG